MRFLGIAARLEHTIAGMQHRSVWPRLKIYSPHEGPSLANQNRRKLEVFDRKLEGQSHLSTFLITLEEKKL